MLAHFLALLALLSLQAPGELPLVAPGETIRGEVRASDQVVETERLRRTHAASHPARGPSFRLVTDAPGAVRIVARAHAFKPYLVLRAAGGAVLAEDDYGYGAILPELALELEAGEYVLSVASQYGDPGTFELEVLPLGARSVDPTPRATLEFALDGLAALEAREVPADAALGTALHRAGFAHVLVGEYAQAEDLLRRAHRVRADVLGEHPHTADSLRNLAAVLHHRGADDEARAAFGGALAVYAAVLGDEHPSTVRALSELATLLQSEGELDAARPLWERALSASDAAFGPGHPRSLEAAAHLGVILDAAGEREAARPLLGRVLVVDPEIVNRAIERTARPRPFWNDVTSRVGGLAWALVVAALFAWSTRARRREGGSPRLADRLLAASLFVSALLYVNFLTFHFGTFTHRWDTFHYYVGAKYFDELGYDGLYACVAIADSEEPELREWAARRQITDLATNGLVSASSVVANPGPWKARFSSERWEAFRADIAWFRDKEASQRWADMSTDHGYNATPVWGIAGTLLANLAPASDTQILLLGLIDPALYVAMIALLVHAFGWRIAAVALAVFATSFPGRFVWTGGGYLRWDWLLALVASIAFLRRGRPMLGGAALGYATLVRVFPLFVFAGPLAAAALHVVRNVRRGGRWSDGDARPWLRFFGGAALAGLVLVPISLVTSGGAGTYGEFVRNSRKHTETRLSNYMGLRTVLGWRPEARERTDADWEDPGWWSAWTTARIENYRALRPLHGLIAIAWLLLLALAARDAPPWAMVALGVTMIPIGVALTCYYYAFVVGVAVLAERKPLVGILLLLLSAATQLVSLAPLPGMPTWEDQQFVALSALTIAAFAGVLVSFALDGQRAGRSTDTSTG